MRPEEVEAADAWIDKHFSFVVPGEDDNPTLEWVLERAAAAIKRYEASLVIIDPFNEMANEDRPPGMSMTEYVGFAIKQFKRLARKYQVHLILVAHPAKMLRNKDGIYPVPGLWDISDSAQFNNKADVGVVIHRPDIVNNPESAIRVVKVRYQDQIGRPGEIKGVWNIATTRYTITNDGGMGSA